MIHNLTVKYFLKFCVFYDFSVQIFHHEATFIRNSFMLSSFLQIADVPIKMLPTKMMVRVVNM